MLVAAVFAGLAGGKKVSYAYDEKAAIIKVNSSVNVRTGAGTGNEELRTQALPDQEGQKVQLSNGKEVTIIDEAPATDGSLWYKIRFTYTDNNQYEGFVRSDFVAMAAADDAFEAYLNEQGFPDSYKPALRTLHAAYPNWSFKAFHTNLDWNASLDAETVLGRNLVHNGSSPSSWKSVQNGAYNWDTSTWISFDSGGWVMASREIVQYYMDPRNFLTDQAIFMFLYQSYNEEMQNKDGLSYIVANTFLNNNDIEGTSYSDMLIEAARQSQVSPYVLASAILQEMGTSGNSGSARPGKIPDHLSVRLFPHIAAPFLMQIRTNRKRRPLQKIFHFGLRDIHIRRHCHRQKNNDRAAVKQYLTGRNIFTKIKFIDIFSHFGKVGAKPDNNRIFANLRRFQKSRGHIGDCPQRHNINRCLRIFLDGLNHPIGRFRRFWRITVG